MRSENRFQLALPELDGASTQSHKCLKFSYSRDFLFSLGRTDRCKNLPRDFDPSMLHDSEDASTGLLMTPFDLDCRHSGNLSRGLMQNPCNDGLLGSGYMATASSSKIQDSNGCNLLKKSDKPYRPPHFYKVMSHSGREHTDSCNKETLGSDFLSCEKAKEERSRKDSFQLTMKDQHKAIQEKHSKTLDEPKSENSSVPPASYGGSTKGLSSTPSLSPKQSTEGVVSRSFAKNSGTKLSTNSSLAELHETSNGNSEELNQLLKPAMIQEVYTCKDLEQSTLPEVNEKHPTEHDQARDDGQYKSSNGGEDCPQGGIIEKDLKLSSDQSKTSSDKLHPRFESYLPHNLISSKLKDQVDLNKNKEHHSVSDDSQPHENAEFTNEYDLPDEDSLFTFDYSIEADSDHLDEKAGFTDKSGQLGLGNSTFHHNPLDAIGMETYNIYAQQYPQKVPYLHPQGPQQGHRSSKTKAMNSRPYPNNWYPRNVPLYPFPPPQPLFWPAMFVSSQYDPMQAFPASYYGMPNPDPGFGAYNNQVAFNTRTKTQGTK